MGLFSDLRSLEYKKKEKSEKISFYYSVFLFHREKDTRTKG